MPRPSSLRPTGVSQDRQRRLLAALMDAGEAGLCRPQMAKLFGGQTRAVERALNALQMSGATISACYPSDGSRQKRFVLTRPPTGDPWPLPMEAHLTLRVAEESLRRIGGAGWMNLHPLRTLGSDQGLGPKAAQRFARAIERTAVRGTASHSDGLSDAVLSALMQALSEPNAPRMELTYRAAGRIADRIHEIIPHAVLQDAVAGGPYLIAWATAQQRPVIYRVSRMLAARRVGQGGLSDDARKVLARITQHQVGAWATADEPMRIRVRVTGARWAQHFLNSTPDLPEVAVEPDPDHPEGVIVTFLATAPEGAVRWILQMGGAAEVLEPPSIREAVAQELERATQRYRAPTAPSAQA
ncbi:MAG: WYL domain-containing protein [Nitrospira sp.]|nr:WYL domain-containing protein [Nitrospira sp.]